MKSHGTDKRVMSHGLLPRICTHNIIHMNVSCRTYAYIFHTWHDLSVSQWCSVVGCITVRCDVFQCVAVFSVLHVTHMHARVIFDMTHSSVTWLIHLCHKSQVMQGWFMHTSAHVWHDSFMCDMTHSSVTWLIHLYHESQVMQDWCMHTSAHVWQDSFMCDMTHSRVAWFLHLWHDSFIYDLSHSAMPWVISHVWLVYAYVCTSLKRRIHVWHDSFMCDMTHLSVPWLRSHVWLLYAYVRVGLAPHMNAACQKYGYAMSYSHTWACYTHVYTYGCVMYVRHDAFIYMTSRVNMCDRKLCDMTHSSVAWLIHHGIRMYTYECVMSDSCMCYGTTASKDICHDVSRCTYL